MKNKKTSTKSSKRGLSRNLKPSSKKPLSTEKIRDYIRSEGQTFLDDPNINSIGLGYKIKDGKATSELAIQFTVDEKVAENSPEWLGLNTKTIPKVLVINGQEIKTDVIKRKYEISYTVLKEREVIDDFRKQRLDVVQPGISISHYKGTAGTFGCIVYDKETSQPLILSNWHVLHGPDGRIGDTVTQPGPYDDNTNIARNKIGRLVRSHLGVAGDCAVSSIDERSFTNTIFELNLQPTGIARAELGDKVVKSGRTTGVTYGVVRRIDVTTKINYGGNVGVQRIGGFEIGPDNDNKPEDGEISMGGDSGSSWIFIDKKSGKKTTIVAGLHFAGESSGSTDEHAIACYIHSVFKKLNITLNQKATVSSIQEIDIESYRGGYNQDFLKVPVKLPSLNSVLARKAAKSFDGKSVINYVHYSLVMNKERRMAFFTACNIDGNSLRKISRKDKWLFDDRLEEDYQLGNDAYKDNKLDRGHMVRRLDTVWGTAKEAKLANDDTFYYTNACPQHAKLNQRTWNDLEDYILDNADVHDLKVNVFTGPVLNDDDPKYRDFKIPQEFWKVVSIVKEGDDELSVTAYILSQSDYMDQLEAFSYGEFRTYQVPVTLIAKKTKLNFGDLSNFDPLKNQPQILGKAPSKLIEKLQDIII
jgi:endonuclease G